MFMYKDTTLRDRSLGLLVSLKCATEINLTDEKESLIRHGEIAVKSFDMLAYKKLDYRLVSQ